MGNFFKAMATSAGYAAGEKLINGDQKQSDPSEIENKRLEVEQKQFEQNTARNEMESITGLSFGETANEISEALNMLFSKAAQLPTGFAALGDSAVKAKKNAILEKLEYGLFKLSKIDAESALFFQKKFDALSGKKK